MKFLFKIGVIQAWKLYLIFLIILTLVTFLITNSYLAFVLLLLSFFRTSLMKDNYFVFHSDKKVLKRLEEVFHLISLEYKIQASVIFIEKYKISIKVLKLDKFVLLKILLPKLHYSKEKYIQGIIFKYL